MSNQSAKKINSTIYADNYSWHQELYLDGNLVVFTVNNKNVIDQLSTSLKKNKFSLVDTSKENSITLHNKNMIEATEFQEVHLEKLRVTEASIVSHIGPDGKKNQVYISEVGPTLANTSKADEVPATTEVLRADFTKIENERFVYRQEVTRNKNSYFFRAKDSAALFKLGSTFYELYKTGINHFSFSHLRDSDAQKKSILGIASFFHYHENLKILVVTQSLLNSCFSEFRDVKNLESATVPSFTEFEYNFYRHEGINYLEIDEIIEKSKTHQIKDQVYLLQNLISAFDVVLFDLPEVSQMKEHYDTYFPILQIVQNVSFVIGMEKATFTEISSLKSFFENYKVKINGVIVGRN